MTVKLAFLFMTIFTVSAHAFPKKCVGDDASGHVAELSGSECNRKCLVVASKNAPANSNAVKYIGNMPTERTGRCSLEDGTPGLTGHGDGCYAMKTLKYVTPCDL